jgi:hypothetical protein
VSTALSSTSVISAIVGGDPDELFIRSIETEIDARVVHQTSFLWSKDSHWEGRVLTITQDNDLALSQSVEVDLDHLPDGYRQIAFADMQDSTVEGIIAA